jgi:hypothetical protein
MDVKNLAKNLVSGALGLTDDAIVTSIDRRDARGGGESVERNYKVQFNPGELTIDASVRVEPMADAERAATVGSEATTPLKVDNPNIFLTVRLVFDEMDPADAFVMDKVTLSTSRITKAVANQAVRRGAARSVQPVVEGFIGAIRNSDTRLLRFNWGEFRFTGFLQHLHAEYVMFSPSGHPIRAYVTLRLKNDFDSDMALWLEEVDTLKENQVPTGLEQAKSAAGNLLNLGW